MNWIEVRDNNGDTCYRNDERGELLYLVLPYALKHHFDKNKVFDMWEGIQYDHIVKPSQDIHAGSSLDIVGYLDVYAELGYTYLGDTYDEFEIPNDYEAYDIFHAFCAKKNYYDYSDYDVDAIDGIRNKWYNELELYHQGGYHAN